MKTLTSWALVLVITLTLGIGVFVSDTAAQSLPATREQVTFGNICGPLPATFAGGAQQLFTDTLALPYIFVFTRYEFIGDHNNPEGVVYHPNGQPAAEASDGSSVTLSGQGGWDPANATAAGGGDYTIKDATGAVTAHGSWQVTGFISFDQLVLDGWWGIPGFREEGWVGGPNAVSFSGFLAVNVNLENLGNGVLRAWCLMPSASMSDTHVGDGISLVGDNFNFAGTEQAELTMFENMEGVMFYSTDPNAQGWVLTPAGIAVVKDEGLQGFTAPSSPDGGGYNPN